FSDPVRIAGKDVPAGAYALFAIPGPDQWTWVLNRQAKQWGAYFYKESEDLLRWTARPRAIPHQEWMEYDVQPDGERAWRIELRWEKLAVPVRIDVDTPAVVMTSMRGELRGQAQFFWEPWAQAASYWLANGGNLDEAQRFADKALTFGAHFRALRARAAIADKRGDAKKAEALRAEAMKVAEENDLNLLGYNLIGQKKLDEAIDVFRLNVKAHPQSWNVYDSLAEAYVTKGDKAAAVENYTRALSMVKDDANKKRITETLAKLKKD
ncbi:MAG TPA: DUF2911 domain-containing protein, partial [Polyangia bacterium]